MTVIHLFSIPWLGFGVHRFLRTHGLESVATVSAISTMALPSMLFAGWISVESDGIGAAFVCEAGWALQCYRKSGTKKYLFLFALMALGAATTKETSAAAMWGYLACFTWIYRKEDLRRIGTIALTFSITLFVLVLPFLMATSQKPHDFHVQSAGFEFSRVGYFLLHNGAQLFYIASSAGALLILLMGRNSPARLLFAAAVLVMTPPLRIYNHYESIIIDQIEYVSLIAAILIFGLLSIFSRRDATPEQRILSGTALFLPMVLAIAPIIALQTRPDVSARLYAPIVPILHGFAWMSARTLFRSLPTLSRWNRPPAWIVLFCFAFFPLVSANNGIQQFRARMWVESRAKPALAEQLKRDNVACPFIIAVNRDHELAAEELESLGVNWDQCTELFVPNRVQLDPSLADFDEWRIQGHRYDLLPTVNSDISDALLAGHAPARCSYLYLQNPKAMMETQNFTLFSGDFSWAYGHLPEFDEEVYAQQIEIQYREQIGYQMLFKRSGATEIAYETPFTVLPTHPNELFGRLLSDLPVIETYAYEGRLFFFENCTTY
jgi:hypothetical protein